MSNKYTRGPWTLKHVFGENFAVQTFEIRGMLGNSPNIYPIFNKDRSSIDCGYIHTSPEDAKLLVKAPELVEALIDSNEILESLRDHYDVAPHILNELKKLTKINNALIQEATGKQ